MDNDTRSANPPGDVDWEALARYAAGEAPPADAERITRWLADHPEHEASLSVLFAAIGRVRADDSPDLSDADTASALRAVKSRGKSEPAVVSIEPRLRANPWNVRNLAIAAGLVIAISGLGLRYLVKAPASSVPSAPEIASSRTYTTPVGKSDSVVLSDGSRIALAPGSSVVVGAGYGRTHRTVTLHGEAFFVAVHDTTRPFTVLVDGAAVRDVGTSFSVRSDRPNMVRVTVASGAVVLRATSDTGAGTTLRASDVGVIEDAVRGRVTVRHHSTEIPTGEPGRIVFDEATMREAADVLDRWFGIEVKLDSAVARRHISFSLTNMTPVQAIDVITRALGATSEWQNTTVTIHAGAPPNPRR